MSLIVGLDIGTTKVCCLVARWNGTTAEAIGYGVSPCKGVRQGQVIDLEETVHAIQQAVQEAQQRADVTLTDAIVGVTGTHIESIPRRAEITISRPDREITDEDLDRLRLQLQQVMLPPDRELLHVIIRQYIVDRQPHVLNPRGMSASHVEAEGLLITGGLTFLQNIRRGVERAGLEVRALVLEPYASGLAVLSQEEREVGVALIDIGGGTSDVAIFHDGFLAYSGIVPLGGTQVSRDIYLMFRISSPEEAERLKLEQGYALAERVPEDERVSYKEIGSLQERRIPRKLLAEVIEERMKELFEMVHDEIVRSGLYEKLSAGIVLTGGGACLPCTAELGRQIFAPLPVRVGTPQPLFGGLSSSLLQPSFATAVGLVVYGAQIAPPPPVHGRVATVWQRLVALYRRLFHRHH